jgi:uncharacterized membrane protein
VTKGRLEAFSDGVLAIILTIMVLEMKVPQGGGASLAALGPLYPVFLSYVLSFLYIGIYWNNHHHLLQTASRVNGPILWANLHLLFWLSLTPFVTGWMGQNRFATVPVALYGFVLLMCGVAYAVLVRCLIHQHGNDSVLARAIGRDGKGKFSLACYVLAIVIAFANRYVSLGLYALVALLWLIPDLRIEKLTNKFDQ